ncbi:hypothetical protein [Desulfobacter curvatus]|uniref:hypothetical protein n=1 Tax=Desulfobacter curvatus TaxID=2290 RepID=UPI000361C61E|nr:hypothetical protein [Desulfobacter curvatus]
MIDLSIIFVVRELIIKLYEHDTATEGSLTQFGVLLLCMGIIRTSAVCFSPANEK